ncbi:MAG TPA: histidine phosphatase family protein [Nocardioidaceae bacterium]|nr:histidine phosphatase family protein [Nocardioidaceae bacterium]
MSVLLLVRHGQASFGAADYDLLSSEGEKQSQILGAALSERGIVPTRAVRGAMKRHAQTAEGAGFPDAVVDAGWDEFDHVQVLSAHVPPESDEAVTERRSFQRWFELATERWMTGDFDDEYDESFSAFTGRVDAALRRTVEGLGSGDTAVVFTSGGAIGAVASALLGGSTDLWSRLNSVTVNTGITKVVVGSRGMTLVSFNDHVHLEPDHVTYR